MDFSQVLAGFLVGAVVGTTGVGGGALMTPLLILLFGVAPATAVGTDLLFAAATKSGGTLIHARRGTVDWRITGLLAAGSLPAAGLTLALTAALLPQGLGAASRLITLSLGIALVLTASALLFRDRLQGWVTRHAGTPSTLSRRSRQTVAVGALLGTLVSLTSVGAGALGVTALLFLHPGLAAARIVGADLAHAVPLTLVAGLGHWWLGDIDWQLLLTLLAGSLPGIWLGSHLSSRLPEGLLRHLLAGMLILVGSRLVLA